MTPNDRDHLIEQYLDGQLAGERLAAFEARLRAEPDLAAEVQRQREIEDSMRRRMALPSAAVVQEILTRLGEGPARLAEAANQPDIAAIAGKVAPVARAVPFTRWLAAAALIAITIGGLWTAWIQWQSGSSGVSSMLLDPVAYYKRKTETGFQPVWKCDTDHEFAKFFVDRYGQPVLLRPMPKDVTCAGIDYTTVLSGDTASLLINDGSNRIVVLLDRQANDRPLDLPKNSGLRSFRRNVGEYVAYEITPLESSHILDLLYIPDRVPDMPPGAQSQPADNGKKAQAGNS